MNGSVHCPVKQALYSIRRSVFAGLCTLACVSGAPALAADSATVDPAAMPVVVRQVLAAKYPGWTVDHVAKATVNGTSAYNIRLTDNSMAIDVVLDEGGHIIEAARGAEEYADSSRSKKGKGKKSPFGKPKVYGFAQMFYRHAFDTGIDDVVDNDNFRVQRVRIGFKGDITPWASYVVEVDPRAPEVTGILRDAYLRLDLVPHHEIRLGQQKTQFGYENRESSTELYAVNRAELSDTLSRGINLRDIGIGIIGKIPLNDSWRIEDALTVVNGAGINVQNDDTSRKNFWGRVGLRHKNGDSWERLGISGGTGDFIDIGDPLDPADDFVNDFDRVGVDLEVNRQWFFFSSEYVSGTDRIELVEPDPDVEPETSKPDGYYFNLVGKTPWHVGPMVRYDVYSDTFARWTFGAYYGEPKDKFRVLLNYEYREKFEDALGQVGRGDDKLYLWTQFKF